MAIENMTNFPDGVLLPLRDRIVVSVGYSVVSFAGIVGNLLIIMAILSTKKLRSNHHNCILVFLTSNDFVTCSLSAPFGLYMSNAKLVPRSNENTTLCKLVTVTVYTVECLTILLLCVLSFDRYLAIARPYIYQRYVTHKRVLLVNFFMVGLVMATFLPTAFIEGCIDYVYQPGMFCNFFLENMSLTYVCLVMLIYGVVPWCIIFYCNVKVFLAAWRMKRKDFKMVRCFNSTVELTLKTEECDDVSKVTSDEIRQNTQTEQNNSTVDWNYQQHSSTHTSVKSNVVIKESLEVPNLQHFKNKLRGDVRIAFSTLAMILNFTLLMLPFPIVKIAAISKKDSDIDSTWYVYTVVIMISASAVNPLVILSTRRELRQTISRMVHAIKGS